ncbi:excinuclease ABC subunit UvrA [bacterium]|jgi:excinuclease ABC subunit A|nr:excinuclease ABC subunit UvrA [bacterium]MBT4251564.1 excinuclease ABC subunit UvrA [bacterium]MBT4597613.1 excinuclease ABC subunit UvrA [bacterium]MBT6753627.1 excinuclease ABC subunit UvrA [bacterium]MBT7037764.1 excinuclease ABC subunit UvrA [bacterium]
MGKHNKIIIKEASQNNLKKINIEIPKDKLVVVTGVSGSGKSSLAFDTLYAEGYRRYVENLSSHARFFLQSVKKPKTKSITNLSPAIAIDQKSDLNNPRSTVGTITDIYDFFRVLFAEAGQPFCAKCGGKMEKQNEEVLINKIRKMPKGTRILVLAKWNGEQKTSREKINAISSQGFARVRIAGKIHMVSQISTTNFPEDAEVQVVIDRLMLLPKRFDRERIVDSLQTAAKMSKGTAILLVDGEQIFRYSKQFRCSTCDNVLPDLSPKNFSFNSPEGACELCTGLGVVFRADEEKIIPSKTISINEGAIMPWSRSGGRVNKESCHSLILKALAKKYKFKLNVPIGKIPKEKLDKILYGTGDEKIAIQGKSIKKQEVFFKGVAAELENRYINAESSFIRNEVEKYLTKVQCHQCEGKRLKKDFLAIKVLGRTIDEYVTCEIESLLKLLKKLKKEDLAGIENQFQVKMIEQVFEEIIARLEPFEDVGLGYLNLNRSNQTLSGGEFQRVRLSTQLYSGLSDVIYVLDEPSIGLHPRDTRKLIKTLRKLQKCGNSVVVVEHDKDIILAADHLIDIGPKAGEDGGEVVFEGTIEQLRKADTKTARHLFAKKGKERKVVSKNRKSHQELVIKGARHNNLKDCDVSIPLLNLVSVVGVSGGGKSSLINDILAKAVRKEIHGSAEDPGEFDQLIGVNNISKVVIVDQGSIGRSPRSNAATYTGVFSHIRKLFAQTEVSQKKNFTASHFSFNMRGGRCEYCQGEGMKKIEMHLLNDVYTDCQYCNGTRYSNKMLEVKYHGATIVDVLGMSVDYAYHFFSSNKIISGKLGALRSVGLGYLKLGQSATELSGGEAQRIKLASELARKSNGNTLYILDEPTIGLHFSDVQKLLAVLQGLVDADNSVLVVEHNTDVIEVSDYVIEIGPEGGAAGGRIVFEGTPKELKKAKTLTSKYINL